MRNQNITFDKQVARQWCMVYGTFVGILTSASFLCAMYGLQSPLLGQFSNLLALLGFFVAIKQVRHFARTVSPLSFRQACWMSLQVYFFTILLTAIVQFVYFQFFDNGHLADQMSVLIDNKDYRRWMNQIAADMDVDTMMKQTLATLRNPVRATMQLMWMNCIVGLMLTLPTALFCISLPISRNDTHQG